MKERIEHKGELLGLIIRGDYNPSQTEFFTPNEFKQQVGYIFYDTGQEVAAHIHHNMPRSLEGTSEVLILKTGHARIDFYSQDKQYLESREIFPGDIIILVFGGHGIHFYEPSLLLEIKQGPYIGVQEKERFPSAYPEQEKLKKDGEPLSP
ncbi:MAG: hypothetical protein K9L86_03030 [Candidatus Omnitrophica bacterium]|nr:hypothetical protein [Candidatus Omnitrophota bacterium]